MAVTSAAILGLGLARLFDAAAGAPDATFLAMGLGVWAATVRLVQPHSFITARASVRALAGSTQGFVRTPKHAARKVGWGTAWLRALALTRFEASMASALGATGVAVLADRAVKQGVAELAAGDAILGVWLLWATLVFGSVTLTAAWGSRGPD